MYLKTFISFFLALLVAKELNNFIQISGFILNIILGLALVLFPIWAARFLYKNLKDLSRRGLKRRYSVLYNRLNLKNKKSLIYPPLFFYRRVFFVVLAFTVNGYTYFQTQALVMVHLFYIMFIGQVYPNKNKSD